MRYSSKKMSKRELQETRGKASGVYGVWDNVRKEYVIQCMCITESHAIHMANIMNDLVKREVRQSKFKGRSTDFK